MKIIILFALIIITNSLALDSDIDNKLEKARLLYYKSVEDRTKIDEAIELFQELGKEKDLEAVALTYVGSLTALRAKHAFWPQAKLKFTNHGLKIMDEAINKAPENIEALFIYGSTCFYLPFFFNRNDEAQQSFHKIVHLLPENIKKKDEKFTANILTFIIENIELPHKEKNKAQNLLSRLEKS